MIYIECCMVVQEYDKEVHCQHISLFGGEAHHRHRKCCQHAACKRRRGELV